MAKAMHIRKDDTVVVIAGKDKGKTGRVLRTEPAAAASTSRTSTSSSATQPRSVKDTQKAQAAASSRRRGRSTSPT